MRTIEWSALSSEQRTKTLARPRRRRDAEIADVVRRIFEEVEAEGGAAVRRWSQKLDGAAPSRLDLTPAVVDAARAGLEPEDIAALELAVDNVSRYHEATKPRADSVDIAPGVRCRRLWRPIASCGLYIPAGSAPLFSTLIMLALPARAAGVPQRVAVSPPSRDGGPHPAMIAAAAACGFEAFWLVGGAQAIAALTFGAELPKCVKLFGPGNAYVAEAKRYAASLPGGAAIDVPAGPSELMVIADANSAAAVVAADLLSQAEHDADAQVLLVSPDPALLAAAQKEVDTQISTLPREAIARAALANARFILVRDLGEATDIANLYAPEHLSLQADDAEALVARIDSAGAVFVGGVSAETFGDYVCGPSHVLPTDGAGAAWSGVSTASFMRSLVVQEMDATGAAALAPAAARLARLEGLEAHARAADIRVRR